MRHWERIRSGGIHGGETKRINPAAAAARQSAALGAPVKPQNWQNAMSVAARDGATSVIETFKGLDAGSPARAGDRTERTARQRCGAGAHRAQQQIRDDLELDADGVQDRVVREAQPD